MAAFAGKYGLVQFDGGATVHVTSWSVTAESDVSECTPVIGEVSSWSDLVGSGIAAGDIVIYLDTALYQCHTAHTAAVGKEPTETAYWTTNVMPSKDYLAGIKRWSATVTGYFDNTGLDPDFATDFAATSAAAVALYPMNAVVGQIYYSGNAWVQNIAPSQDVNGVPQITYTLRGDGALTEGTYS